MWRSVWQIGVDIQAHQLLAVAASRQTTGWQLQQWWQLPLPPDLFCDAQLQQPTLLSDSLRAWQQQLPRSYHLLCALPAALTLQANLTLSEQGGAIDEIIQRSLPTLFPLPTETLAYDYCYPEEANASLLVTIARRVVVEEWFAVFSNARLFLSVLEVVPCVLRSLARQQQQHPLSLLLSLQSSHAVIISPLAASLQFTILPLDTSLLANAYRWCIDQCGITPTAYLVSGVTDRCGDCLAGNTPPVTRWNPFTHCMMPLPRLPPEREAFAIACGLATRTNLEDS